MDFISVLVGFILGVLGTLFTLYVYVRVKMRKTAEKLKEQAASIKEKSDAIMKRLQRVKELTEKQQQITNEILQPSQNTMHSVHKMKLLKEHGEYEKEKIDLLRHVVYKDEVDTDISVLDQETGELEEMKLSDFLKKLEDAYEQSKKAFGENYGDDTDDKEKDIKHALKSFKGKNSPKDKPKITKKETEFGTVFVIGDEDDDGHGTIN